MEHVFDLSTHETTRLAAVLDALDGNYDPLEVQAEEARATAMLYSGLDEGQEAMLRELRDAGVL